MPGPAHTSQRPRLWPAALIVLLSAVALVAVWSGEADHRQGRVMQTGAVAVLTSLLLLAWLLLLSRLPVSARLAGLGLVVGLGLLFAATVRVRGVSGDLVPVLEWRFAGAPALQHGKAGGSPAAGLAFPQFLGPTRDGRIEGIRIDPDWDRRPPEELWRRPVGPGWSGFVVADGLAVTQEQRGDAEHVTAFDLASGEERWTHAAPARFEEPISGAGPRATPLVVDGTLFALGGTGRLTALSLQDGRELWSRDVAADHGAEPPTYGYSASPLAVGPWVVVGPGGSGGGSLAAYRRSDGAPAWSGGDDPAAYSSPRLLRLAGREQIVWLNQRNLTGHDARDGRVLWSVPWSGGTERVTAPVDLPGDRLFVSTGYGIGGRLFELRAGGDGFQAHELWHSRGLKSKLSNVVAHEGHLYGLDDGILVCLDVADGRRRWKRGRYGHGQLLLVGGLLLIQAENGDVALVEARPDAYRERARIGVLDLKTWNHPTLAGPYLLVRNDREAACLELPLLAEETP